MPARQLETLLERKLLGISAADRAQEENWSKMAPAERVADKAADAYSVDRYRSWRACAAALLGLGYTESQAVEILRSKITRWAADVSDKPYGRATALDLVKFLRDTRGSMAEILREIFQAMGV